MSGLGEKDMERNMIKRESSWYRRLGVGACNQAFLGLYIGSYSPLLAARSCLIKPLFLCKMRLKISNSKCCYDIY